MKDVFDDSYNLPASSGIARILHLDADRHVSRIVQSGEVTTSLLSLVAFVLPLSTPRLRPYAFRALVAPVAFGFCSIVAMVLILVASYGLNLQFANAPLTGARGLFEGIAVFFLPGLVGAWIAVEIVRQVEVRALKTRARREFATRTIIALIVFGPVFTVCIRVQFNIFSKAEEWWPAFLAVSFTTAVALQH
jgi:hypothetical protein